MRMEAVLMVLARLADGHWDSVLGEVGGWRGGEFRDLASMPKEMTKMLKEKRSIS